MKKFCVFLFLAIVFMLGEIAFANEVLFEDNFDGDNGQIIDNQADDELWIGRYPVCLYPDMPNDVSAVIDDNRCKLNSWRSISTKATFQNESESWLACTVTLFNESTAVFIQDRLGSFGIAVSYDGVSTVTVKSNNIGYGPQTYVSKHSVESVNKNVTATIYVKGKATRVDITDDRGTWFAVAQMACAENFRFDSSFPFRLRLGYHGFYDNVSIKRISTLPDCACSPIANAGPNVSILSEDQCVTVIKGCTFNLNGDPMTYRWIESDKEGENQLSIWQDVGANGEANLYLCNVPFSIGEHKLILEVSDGLNIASDEMILTIDNPALTPAEIDIDPDTINLKSKGQWITCYIEPAEGYDANYIDIGTVWINIGDISIPAEISPTEVGDYDSDGILDLMVKFDRRAVQEAVTTSVMDITVSGSLINPGESFEGADTVLFIDKGKEHIDEEDHASVVY